MGILVLHPITDRSYNHTAAALVTTGAVSRAPSTSAYEKSLGYSKTFIRTLYNVRYIEMRPVLACRVFSFDIEATPEIQRFRSIEG